MTNGLNEKLKMSGCTGTSEMLRQAVRLLCANAVPYSTRLSVDAIIGITIDNSEIIFVNIHERIEKEEKTAEACHSDNRVSTLDSDQLNNAKEITGHDQGQRQQKVIVDKPVEESASAQFKVEQDSDEVCIDPCSTATAKIKIESDIIELDDDDDDPNKAVVMGDEQSQVCSDYFDAKPCETGTMNCEYVNFDDHNRQFGYRDDGYPNSSSFEESDWPAEMVDDCSYTVDNESHLYFQRQTTSGDLKSALYRCRPCQKSFVYHASYLKHRRRHFMRPSASTVLASDNRVKLQAETNSLVDDNTSSYAVAGPEASVVPKKSLVLDSEVGTVHTCSVCGQKIRHLSTFIRHKKKHEGVVYKCDICGFSTSRRDSLQVHRRRCLSKCQELLGVR